MDAKKLTTFLVVTLKTQVFTVTTNAQHSLQHFQPASALKTFQFSKGATVFSVFVEEVRLCHGTMASPSLSAVLQKTTGQAYKNAVICLVLTG